MEEDEFPVETHVYSVNPTVVVGNVRNVVDDYCNDALDSLEGALVQSLRGRVGDDLEQAKANVQKCAERVRQLLAHCFDKNLDKLELYWLRNTFRIPEALYPHLQLPPHLAALAGTGAPDADAEARVDAHLEELHERIQAARHMFTELKREMDFYARHLGPAAEEAAVVRSTQSILAQPLTGGRDAAGAVEHALVQSKALAAQTTELIDASARAEAVVQQRDPDSLPPSLPDHSAGPVGSSAKELTAANVHAFNALLGR